MKKRIISLTLAVVMLFSCLSLNVFATEPAENEAVTASETVVSDTFTAHTDAQIEAAINAVKQNGSAYSYDPSKSIDSTTTGYRFTQINVDGNAKYVRRAGVAEFEYNLDVSDHTKIPAPGSFSADTFAAAAATLGESFVLQSTWNFTEVFKGYSMNIFQIRDDLSHIKSDGASQHAPIQTSTTRPVLLSVNSKMQLIANSATEGFFGSEAVVLMQLEYNKDYTFTVFADPKDINTEYGEYGLYGSFDVYVNGECVGERLNLFTEAQNTALTFDERYPYAPLSSWSDAAGKVLNDGATLYFFSETAPNAQELESIMAEYGITGTNVTAAALGKTKKGVQDLTLGSVRCMTNKKENGPTYLDNGAEKDYVYTIDNIMVYYADEYKDTLADHSCTDQHAHDFKNSTMTVTSVCAYCEGKRVTTGVAIDADGDSICDVCERKLPTNSNGCTHEYVMSHIHGVKNLASKVSYSCKLCGLKVDFAMTDCASKTNSGRIPSVDEIDNLAETVIIAEDFEDGLGKIHIGDNSDMFEVQTDGEDGNGFLSYLPGTKSGYAQINVLDSIDAVGATKSNFETYRGKTYTLTFDFRVEETFAETNAISLFGLRSRLGNNFGSYVIVSPVAMTPDLKIQYNDGKSGMLDTGVTLTKGEWYTISVQHTPKTNSFDLYINGTCVANDAVALSDTDKANMNWTASGYTVTPEDFFPVFVRYAAFAPKAKAFSIDDVKMYYDDECFDCKHKYTTSSVCDWCGKTETHCDLCDGEIISENAAVVAKSVSLGELIDMNVYIKVPGAKSGIATLSCGNKTESFDLAELEADAEGKYKLSLPLTSIMMAEDVTLTVNGGTYTTSIKEYAEDLIASDESDSAKAVAKALLNYGAAAQEYFAVKNNADTLDDILANAGLVDADKVVAELTAADLAAYKFSANGMTADVQYTGATIIFSSKTYMKVYFKSSADATVTVNGKTYAKTEENGQYYVTVTAATPAEALKAFTFVITDGETVATSNISVFTAVHAALSNLSGDTNLVNLVTAYARYCELAKAYVA